MEKTGLLDDIYISEIEIDQGRKWLDTETMEGDGRIRYQHGLTLAMKAFQSVQSLVAVDLKFVILAEYTFITQELQLCDPLDIQAVSSLTNALQSFDDAILSHRHRGIEPYWVRSPYA